MMYYQASPRVGKDKFSVRAHKKDKCNKDGAKVLQQMQIISHDPLAALDREKACIQARKAFAEQHADSHIPDKTKEFPEFLRSEIVTGDLLGRGGFGTVFEIRAVEVPENLVSTPTNSPTTEKKIITPESPKSTHEINDVPSPDSLKKPQDTPFRSFIADSCLRESGEARYAVKFLNPEIIAEGKDRLMHAVLDTATEARFLSVMDHPNIVKLRGLSHKDEFHHDLFDEGMFLVMDRLYDTLEVRLNKWNKTNRKLHQVPGFFFQIVGRTKTKASKQEVELDALWKERIRAVYDLSSAIHYIHDYGLIHRDIKPENIGFDLRGDIKLFDFGLAREIPNRGSFLNDKPHKKGEKKSEKHSRGPKSSSENVFKLTGNCGTTRYMAPEVGRCKRYNEKADVYSFAILLWEIIHLQMPYEEADNMFMETQVWRGPMLRPSLDLKKTALSPCKSKTIRKLLQKSWSPSVSERPSMKKIVSIMRTEYIKAGGGDDVEEIDRVKRRSTHVFMPSPDSTQTTTSTGKSFAASMEAVNEGMNGSSHCPPHKNGGKENAANELGEDDEIAESAVFSANEIEQALPGLNRAMADGERPQFRRIASMDDTMSVRKMTGRVDRSSFVPYEYKPDSFKKDKDRKKRERKEKQAKAPELKSADAS